MDVKTLLYEKLSPLSVPIADYPELNKNKFPNAILRTIGENPIKYKNFSKTHWIFRIDVFSTNKGEKEIRDYYKQEVKNAVDNLLAVDGITYSESSLTVMDDKEQGPVTKHGVISVHVYTMEE